MKNFYNVKLINRTDQSHIEVYAINSKTKSEAIDIAIDRVVATTEIDKMNIVFKAMI